MHTHCYPPDIFFPVLYPHQIVPERLQSPAISQYFSTISHVGKIPLHTSQCGQNDPAPVRILQAVVFLFPCFPQRAAPPPACYLLQEVRGSGY